MAYKIGNRLTRTFLPQSIDEYVSEDNPVRLYDEIIDSMPLEDMGLEINPYKVGNSSYDPVTMVKILAYSYYYGWRSSRKIERELHHNVSFMWISGGLKPDARTICEFRKNNLSLFKQVLKESACVAVKLNLITGSEFFVDSIKMRGVSSIKSSYTELGLEKFLSRLDSQIEELFKSCEEIDKEETGSYVKMQGDLSNQNKRKELIEGALSKLRTQKQNCKAKCKRDLDSMKINLSDEEAVNFRSRQGSHSGYTVQSTVDSKHGLILNVDSESNSIDTEALDKQVENASKVLGKTPEVVCADAGYSKPKDLAPVLEKGVKVVVPSKEQSKAEKNSKKGQGVKEKFNDQFKYVSSEDIYICPKGNKLTKRGMKKIEELYKYKITQPSLCRTCEHFGQCTKSKEGKTILRSKYEDAKQQVVNNYQSDEGKKIYKKRGYLCERPFGHIKRNMNAGYLLLKGRRGADAEMSLLAFNYNITRMSNLLGGVKPTIEALKRINQLKNV